MNTAEAKPTTGLPGLDGILKGILPGDNVVWDVPSIKEYAAFVVPYCQAAGRSGRRLIYFRFASHPPLGLERFGAEVHQLRPEDGFESFVDRIHSVIEKAGRGAYYVFDCLSELAADWYSDQMLGNFFVLTCPYLFDLETIAYFALFRDYHSVHAIRPITETTQLLLETYRHEGDLYVRPMKVQHRYSPTMNMLHVWKGNDFRPVTASVLISKVLASSKWTGLRSERRPGYWERAFIEAEELRKALQAGLPQPVTEQQVYRRLAKMALSRDEEGMLRLVAEYLSLDDILEVRRRMIGTGLIGGKAVGMLLARAILERTQKRFAGLLEQHDSFYIGSDVFYTFLVQNGVWWVRRKQRNPETFLDGSEQARQRILTGSFPDYTLKQFEEMIDYFGQSPFIVRSSSLLEDNFGNSFAGKYESIFCANQGPRERRLQDFLAAVRTVYASTMSEKALHYRAQRNMLDRDEQMALLVMRVSGDMHGRHFFPTVAGVAFSFNPYAWDPRIDPKAGVVRLVFGLGTRAVNRTDDDYTRVVALNAPDRRPETNFDEVRKYAQRRVDYLDLEANQLVSGYFSDLARHLDDTPLPLFAAPDDSYTARRDTEGRRPPPSEREYVLTFDKLLSETGFVGDLREMLEILHKAYNCPVDTEFTANFMPDGGYQINLLQCRPLQVIGTAGGDLPQVSAPTEDRIIEARGAVIGHSRHLQVDRFVYVDPRRYGALPVSDRYAVAGLLGEINRAREESPPKVIMLLGPGRWGTSSPSLGIPVAFRDISRASIICEIVAMREDLIPDVSLGTHFLNELVEMDMLYLALFPAQSGNRINARFFEQAPNRLLGLVPQAGKWEQVVRVVESRDMAGPDRQVRLSANAPEQKVICYLER